MKKEKQDKGFKNFLDDAMKSIHGYYKTCDTCNGSGQVLRYPHYSTVMPEKKLIPCEDCGGRGKVFVAPNNVRIVREPNKYHQ
jgi:DnaJ-class molecular chaperone